MKIVKHLGVVLVMGLWAAMAQAEGQVMADNTWIREAPPGAAAMAGYMTLMNKSDKPAILIGANSPAFTNVMLHRTVMGDGMAKMVHQKQIEIPAHGTVIFEPNGYHLMLMKPKQQLKAGDKVDITLEFKDGNTMVVTHEVRAGMEGMNKGGMDHGTMDHGAMQH